MKTMLLLGAKPHQSDEAFREEYLGSHTARLVGDDAVVKYVANVVREPTAEMIDAGWGWGGSDDSGILGIDEVWTADATDVLALYEGMNVIGAYQVHEVVFRSCSPEWPVGQKSHWIKRMGLLKCFDDQRPEDFHQYWEHIHAPKALRHHIGAGIYEQNHFIKTLKPAPAVWNGSMSLCYWSVEAFKYGHFSQPDSAEVIKEDGSHFMDVFKALFVDEYVMKREHA